MVTRGKSAVRVHLAGHDAEVKPEDLAKQGELPFQMAIRNGMLVDGRAGSPTLDAPVVQIDVPRGCTLAESPPGACVAM